MRCGRSHRFLYLRPPGFFDSGGGRRVRLLPRSTHRRADDRAPDDQRDGEHEHEHSWVHVLPAVPAVDSVDVWPLITGKEAESPRKEIYVGANCAIVGPVALLLPGGS